MTTRCVWYCRLAILQNIEFEFEGQYFNVFRRNMNLYTSGKHTKCIFILSLNTPSKKDSLPSNICHEINKKADEFYTEH